MKKNIIGKKVFLVKDEGYMDVGTEYTIAKVLPWGDDWCQHYIVKDELGMPLEIREVDCVFAPDFSLKNSYMAQKFLNDNGVYAEVWNAGIGSAKLCVEIDWGDWKHEHGWCEQLMQYIGYKQISEEVTEEDGSDCYSAIHTYIMA